MRFWCEGVGASSLSSCKELNGDDVTNKDTMDLGGMKEWKKTKTVSE